MTDTIKLSEVEAVLARGPFSVDIDGDTMVYATSGKNIKSSDMRVLRAALPVLVRVAAIALSVRDANDHLDAVERNMLYVGGVSFDELVGQNTIRDAKVKMNEAGAALVAALAKVTA